jgi:hypothetical protein
MSKIFHVGFSGYAKKMPRNFGNGERAGRNPSAKWEHAED